MNNKGFMMAEVVVVSAIVLAALTGLYISYNKIYMVYRNRIDYYDTVALYRLEYYRDMAIDEGNANNIFDWFDSEGENYANLEEYFDSGIVEENDDVYMVSSTGLENFKNSVNTFSDYIEFLDDSVDIDSEYVLLIKRCNDSDKCKFGYLEFYDGIIGDANE